MNHIHVKKGRLFNDGKIKETRVSQPIHRRRISRHNLEIRFKIISKFTKRFVKPRGTRNFIIDPRVPILVFIFENIHPKHVSRIKNGKNIFGHE